MDVFVWCVCVCLSAVSEAHSAIRLSKEELPLLSHTPPLYFPLHSSLSALNLISFLYLQAAFVVENMYACVARVMCGHCLSICHSPLSNVSACVSVPPCVRVLTGGGCRVEGAEGRKSGRIRV